MPLRVVLAGHNLDRELLLDTRRLLEEVVGADSIEELNRLKDRIRAHLSMDNWTPETIAAAYARVSRDPQSVTRLRAIAREAVDKARRSNESIVFGLGHASVAEHAVFNFDVEGLSRLAVETLESGRLASYTEKSQRYILLDEDWVLPEEIRGTEVEPALRELVAAQNRFYREAYDRLLPQILSRHPEMADDRAGRRALEGMAKEDARYGLSLATTVQLGLTLNARSLEGLLARCAAHGLLEVRELGGALRAESGNLAPSLVKYVEPTRYQREGRRLLAEAASRAIRAAEERSAAAGMGEDRALVPQAEVELITTTPDPDATLLAALLYAAGAGSMETCGRIGRSLTREEGRAVLLSHLRKLGPHDAVLREYEHVDLVFDLVVSASCFAQLKRHRLATITPMPYDVALGVTMPDSFRDAGLEDRFRELLGRGEECSRRIEVLAPVAASYALSNAHRRRVLVKLNAREMYHVSRLREDAHAQWDVRRLAERMCALARERMPLTLALAAGKDRFEERYREVFPTP